MKEFAYGERENLGYGFLYEEGLSGNVKIQIEKHMTLSVKVGSLERSSLRFIPLKEGSLLLFLVGAPGSARDIRGEVFVWGYQFTLAETDAMLRYPQKLFSLPEYNTYEEWLEDEERREKVQAILENAHWEKDVSYLSKEELARVEKYYIYCAASNDEELRCQLHQIFSILDKKAVEATVSTIFRLFPLSVRRQISFCVNPLSIPETNGFELNFVEQDIYNGFIKTHYDGAMVVDRIALFEDRILTTISKEELDSVYNSYLNCSKEELRNCTSRADFRALLDKKRALLREEKRKESSTKTAKSVSKPPKEKNGKGRERAFLWIKRVFTTIKILILLMITAGLCSLLSIQGDITGGITIHISTSTILFVLQFVVAFLWANLWVQFRNKRKKGRK